MAFASRRVVDALQTDLYRLGLKLRKSEEQIELEHQARVEELKENSRRKLEEFAEATVGAIADARRLARQLEAEVQGYSECVRVGSLAFSQTTAEAERLSCFIPLLDKGSLIVKVSAIESAQSIVQSVVLRTLASNPAGGVLLHVIDPLFTAICSPFGRLRDVNTAIAPTNATRVVEVSSLLSGLQSTIADNIQLLQGKWSTLGSFLKASKGEDRTPMHLLVVLGWPADKSDDVRNMLRVVLERGPANGVSTVIVDDGSMDMNVTGSTRVETVDLRGEPRWMRFPTFNLHIDPPPTVDEIRSLCEEIGEDAKTSAAPLVDLLGVLDVDERPMSDQSSERIVVTIGRSGSERVSFTLGDARDNTHNVLIGGSVGTGKSNLLLTMIYSIARRYGPSEVEMYLLDFKEGVEFARFASPESFLPHARLVGIQADARLGKGVLLGIIKELEERSRKFLEVGATNVTQFRTKTGERMPRILLVVDEFQELFNDPEVATENANLLEATVRRGRSFGIHVVLASQTLSGIKGMATNREAIFDQFRVRIALRLSREESTVVMSSMNHAPSELRGRGEAILNTESGMETGNRHVVIAHASDSAIGRITDEMRSATDVPPRVMQRGAFASVQRFESALRSRPVAASALVGESLVFGEEPLVLSNLSRAGRHLMMVGDGDREGVGIIHAITLSAARWSPNALRFLVIGRCHSSAESLLMREVWIAKLKASGAEVVEMESLSGVGVAIDNETTRNTYLVLLGAHDLENPIGETSECGLNDIKEILANGHLRNVTLFGWWNNLSRSMTQLGYEWHKQVNLRIGLRSDSATLREVMASPWFGSLPAQGRALHIDLANMSEPELIIPYEPQFVRSGP